MKELMILFVGSDQSKIDKAKNSVLILSDVFERTKSANQYFYINEDTALNVISKTYPDKQDSYIAKANAVLYFSPTKEVLSHCEEVRRKTNPNSIAIDVSELDIDDCLYKIEHLIEYAKLSKSEAETRDKNKSTLFLLGNKVDNKSVLQVLPTELAKIITLAHTESCNYSSWSFFKKIPKPIVSDQVEEKTSPSLSTQG